MKPIMPGSDSRGRPNSEFCLLFCATLAALTVRLVVMAFLYSEQLDPAGDHWKFAYETGRIARSLATGQGFGNPLFENTGPTAFLTPVYPAIVALIFKLFGVYTKASAIVILSLQAAISSFTAIPVFFFARKSFGAQVANWSAWAWAFFPYAVYFSVERIWSTWLSTLLLSILFWMAISIDARTRIWTWLGFGVLFGITALTDPVVLSVLPLLVGWMCYRLARRSAPWLTQAGLAMLALVLCVSPWFVRNYRVFHRFVPFRDTLGMELLIGNNGDTFHWRPAEIGPWHNHHDWEQFKALGELSYMGRDQRWALAFIRSHPGFFLGTTLRRVVYLWTGFWSFNREYLAQEPFDLPNIIFSTSLTSLSLLGLWRAFRIDKLNAAPYAIVMLCFPLIYYVTHVEVYYRRQIDPMILVLAVYGVLAIQSKRSRAREAREQELELA
ncbi:MAG: glycosyltransferase family 39 protein [Acidobacteria bacterium]|nr:glycosyltransferase family 39 protein [Acidobacteriota bacterium]